MSPSERADVALRRFRRAMRRHIARARILGLGSSTDMPGTLRAIAMSALCNPNSRLSSRPSSWGPTSRNLAAERTGRERDLFRRDAWLFERAADAVARLRAEIGGAS